MDLFALCIRDALDRLPFVERSPDFQTVGLYED